jgi:uncharacterized membrane protein
MTAREPAPGRLWEVDVLRTAAILMMIAYHAAYDVFQLAPTVDLDPFGGGWRALQVACGSTFLFVVGVSLAISNARGRARGLSGRPLYRRHLRRAAEVAAAALLVSVVTLIALGDDYVRFGILHCIAAAMVIGPLLLPLGAWNVPLGVAAIAAGIWLDDNVSSDVPGLLVLGVNPHNGAVDWYPLLPWLGPVLFGLAAGRALYPGGRRGSWGARLPEPRYARALGAPGRHALPIYLIHQPVLIALVAAALAIAGVELSDDFLG